MRKCSVQKDQIVMDISHEQNGRRWWPYLKVVVVVVIVIAFNTGGPRYSRSFYLPFTLFAVIENIPKFEIRGLSLTYLQFL